MRRLILLHWFMGILTLTMRSIVKVSLAGGVALVLLVQLLGEDGRASTVYDAVNDFSVSSNPNGQWSYLYDTGSGPQLLTYNTIPFEVAYPGLNAWWNGQTDPNSIFVAQNATASPVSFLSIVDPPNLLWLDPQADTDIVRWTAPASGTWNVTGQFQGIDVGEQAHNVEILVNYSTVLLAPTTVSQFGQVVPFDQSVSLTAGNTIDFIVAATAGYGNLATGLSAAISTMTINGTWTNGSGGTWSSGGNWAGGNVPGVNGPIQSANDTATFGAAATSGTCVTVTLDTSPQLSAMTFTSTSP
jgi:hypothetical protein